VPATAFPERPDTLLATPVGDALLMRALGAPERNSSSLAPRESWMILGPEMAQGDSLDAALASRWLAREEANTSQTPFKR
jgi:hypothetical protein